MNGDVWDGPCAVGDPMGVETSFARNLGGLMAPAAATSGPGPVGEARRSQARPQDMRSRTPAWYRGRLEQRRVTSAAETVAGRRSVERHLATHAPDSEPNLVCRRGHVPADRNRMGHPSPAGRSRPTFATGPVRQQCTPDPRGGMGYPPTATVLAQTTMTFGRTTLVGSRTSDVGLSLGQRIEPIITDKYYIEGQDV